MPYLHLDLAKTYSSETKRELATLPDVMQTQLWRPTSGLPNSARIICSTSARMPKRTVLVEFIVHSGDEILRHGERTGDWTDAEASAGRLDTAALTAQLT
jgi:hypothetical protein